MFAPVGFTPLSMLWDPVERTIRPIALQRKNALFAGHDAGAQNLGHACVTH
jgi:hypothetical protein